MIIIIIIITCLRLVVVPIGLCMDLITTRMMRHIDAAVTNTRDYRCRNNLWWYRMLNDSECLTWRCTVSHNLRIETGCWTRIPRDLGLCQCKEGIQMEEHALLRCPHPIFGQTLIIHWQWRQYCIQANRLWNYINPV